jgi:sugar/nucleoside kinase (ribokinase family)
MCALPAYPTEKIVDPTGCGDTFAGGMMGALAHQLQDSSADAGSYAAVRRALVHGTVVASYTIEAFSLDRLKQIKKSDLDKRFEEYAGMVRV